MPLGQVNKHLKINHYIFRFMFTYQWIEYIYVSIKFIFLYWFIFGMTHYVNISIFSNYFFFVFQTSVLIFSPYSFNFNSSADKFQRTLYDYVIKMTSWFVHAPSPYMHKITWLSFYWQGKRVPIHDTFRKKETLEFDMSYSKTMWGYSSKAAMKMKTSPQHFQWILRGTVPDSRWGDILRWLLTRITKFLLSALWNPGHKGVDGSAAAPFWQFFFFVFWGGV